MKRLACRLAAVVVVLGLAASEESELDRARRQLAEAQAELAAAQAQLAAASALEKEEQLAVDSLPRPCLLYTSPSPRD